MVKGRLFAKTHFRGEEHIRNMVELIMKTPEIDGLDICVFREIDGKQTDLSQIDKIIDGRFPFSLEYGDTDDTREVIDFLNPKKAYMLEFVQEKLIPSANQMKATGINFHLVGNVINLHPGQLPDHLYPRKDSLDGLRSILADLQDETKCPITVENVHCLSTRRNVDDCIKFASIGNIVQDLFELNWPVALDTSHFGMSFFTYQVLQYLEANGSLNKIEGLEDYVWCPTQLNQGQPGPYPVRFGTRERDMIQLLPTDLTEALLEIMKKLHEVNLIKVLHISNLIGWSKDNLFAYWDNDGWIEGAFDLSRILRFGYYDLGLTVVAELKESNFYQPTKPDFRANLLQVVEILKN